MVTLVIKAIDTYCIKKDEFITKANFCEVYNKYTGALVGTMDFSRYKMLCQGPDLLHFEIDNSEEKNMRFSEPMSTWGSKEFKSTEPEEHSGFRRGNIVSLTSIEEIYYDIPDIWEQHDFKIYKENFKDKKKFFSSFIREHGNESLLNLNYKILAVGTSNVRIEELALIEAANTLLLLVSFYGLKKEK